jgi:formylglycine-generating enzyme required for sulfatase activity
MARAHAQLSAVALALVGLAACQLVAGIEDLVPAPDAGSPAVDAAPAPTVAENGCPRGRGPDMARLGALCIDTTEVTREQYDEFLRDDAGAQPPGCTWNKSFVPGEKTGTPPLCLSTFPRAPVGCVDFCDATMFCLWAKKELCGGPKGGTANFADPGNPTTSAWALACNGGEAARVPVRKHLRATLLQRQGPGGERRRERRHPLGVHPSRLGRLRHVGERLGVGERDGAWRRWGPCR